MSLVVPVRALAASLLAVALAPVALAPALAASPASPPPSFQSSMSARATPDPALEVARLDFRRGEHGAGELVLEFSSSAATPDLTSRDGQVVIDIAGARLPPSLQTSLDVVDFATPVRQVQAQATATGTRVTLAATGPHGTTAYQAGNRYVVEVAPRAPTAEEQTAGLLSPLPVAQTAPAYTGKPVSFNFQDVPVRAVLQILADEARANLVASDTVGGTVTLRLDNVPWDQALDVVLRAKGLDKRRNGKVIWIAPQAEIAQYEQDIAAARLALENSAPLATEYLPISYGSAEDIAALLSSRPGAGEGADDGGFLSPRGSVTFDDRTNTLLVVDTPERIAAVREVVRRLDRPVDQVVIQARIVIANEDFARELGARFGISGATGKPGDRSSVGFGGNLDASGINAQNRSDAIMSGTNAFSVARGLNVNLPSTLAGGTGAVALSILNAGHLLDIELSAMQTEGRGEVISNPRIVTSNQKEAVITQGEEVGYLTMTGGSGGEAAIPQVQFKEALLELAVTPTITNDGRVFLDMSVKKDEVAGFVDTGVGQVPRITKRSVDTAVLMEDGQTVVIGGVYEFKDQQSLSKVPFLADIPILGNLFKKRGRTQTKAELLIMVTPKVIRVAQRPAQIPAY